MVAAWFYLARAVREDQPWQVRGNFNMLGYIHTLPQCVYLTRGHYWRARLPDGA